MVLKNGSDCFTADVKLAVVDGSKGSQAYLKGHSWANTLPEIINFLVTSKSQYIAVTNSLISPLLKLKMKDGLDFSYSSSSLKALSGLMVPRGYRFDGLISFMDLETYAVIDSSISTSSGHTTLQIVFELPSFTLGGDNIQVLSLVDFFVPLTKEEEQRVTKNPVRVVVELDLDAQTRPDIDQLSIVANAKVFDYIHQVEMVMDDDYLTFTMPGNPFNGIFDTTMSVFVDARENKLVGS